jgi:hypothetical protein
MGDDLARKLYEALRTSANDPTVYPAWGNLESAAREAWEAVATLARKHVREQVALQLDAAARMADTNEHEVHLERAAGIVRGIRAG